MTPPDLPFGARVSDLRDLAGAIKHGVIATHYCVGCGNEMDNREPERITGDLYPFLIALADYYDQPR